MSTTTDDCFMNYDIRLDISFFDHPKTLELHERYGDKGVSSLIKLWCWCGRHQPTGDLSGMTLQRIASAIGESPEFIQGLVDIRFIDQIPTGYRMHDWQERQPWASKASERVRIAKLGGKASAKSRGMLSMRANDLELAGNCQLENSSTESQLAVADQLNQGGSTPIPIPIPIPKEKKKKAPDGASGVDLRAFSDWYLEQHLAIRREKYIYQGEKDTTAIKNMLAKVPLTELKLMVPNYIKAKTDPRRDDFLERTGYTIAMMQTRLNALKSGTVTSVKSQTLVAGAPSGKYDAMGGGDE